MKQKKSRLKRVGFLFAMYNLSLTYIKRADKQYIL